jgi:hypothetical protein
VSETPVGWQREIYVFLVGAISVIDWWAAVAGMIAVGVVMEVDRFLENRKKGEIL